MEVFEKSETVDPEVRAYIYSLVSAVGGNSAADGGRYILGDDALACLKDLRRWLKLYDTKLDRFDVKRCLSEANFVKGDLLEILGQWNECDQTNVLRKKLALGSLELLTELTWPLNIDPEKATVNHLRHLPLLELAQVDYKRAILHHESEAILHKAIGAAIPALSIPRRERSPREEGIINLVLYLIRNVITIKRPEYVLSDGDEGDISRAATIHALHSQDVLQLLLTICSSMGDEFQQQDIIMMEVLYHLLKGVDPRKLFKNDQQVRTDQAQDLKRLILAEKSMLANQAKSAPTRHNRFGTMIWVKQPDKLSTMTGQDLISSKEKTFQKMDDTKLWNKPKPRPKKNVQIGDNVDYSPVHLDSMARSQLQAFVADFLDSSFNPLFTQLRKSLERGEDRIKDGHFRQFFFLVSWFLQAVEARKASEQNENQPVSTDPTSDTPFTYVAAVLTQETFVLLNRNMQRFMDEKNWDALHTCLLAFTQIMLVVSAMTESPSEDDQDIAENIQSRIFYEEQTHDRILQVLRGYQDGRQDFPYLDACTEMAHVFIRLLERYSKVNVDMYIRSKRRARRKAKDQVKGTATVEGLDDELNDELRAEDNGDQDEVEAHRQVSERKFDFNRFAAKFVNETSINTFIALLSRFRELNDDQLKRCHRFFYRVAFKMEFPILLYRVDILNLFHRLIQGPKGLDAMLDKKHPVFREWEELVKQLFRRCIRKIEERPELIVEMLFSKIPATLYYLEHGQDKEVVKSIPRPPAELEIKPGMDHHQQIGVAVGVLVDQGKLDVLAWVKTVLMGAIEERRSWEDLNLALDEPPADAGNKSLFGGASDDATETAEAQSVEDTAPVQPEADKDRPVAPVILVKPDSEERKLATFKDKYLRLLLKTLGFERLMPVEDPDSSWIVSSSLRANTLEEDLDSIRKFEFDPPVYEDGKSAESFTRSEAVGRRNAYEKEASDDEGDSDLDEGLFVPGGPTRRADDPREDKPKKKRKLRRKGDELTEAELQERADARKQREKEKDAKVKSALFVTDSDDEDDEEKTAEFFRMEALRRGNAASAMKSALMDGRSGHGEERSSKRKADAEGETVKRRRLSRDSDDEDVVDGETDHEDAMVLSSRESSPASESDVETDGSVAGATPLSSQIGITAEETRKDTLVVDEEEEAPVKSSHRPGRRLFVIDDDESD